MQFIDTMEEVGKKNRREGRQEGHKEVALNMLHAKADMAFIVKVTGLPETEIIRFKDNGLKSQTKAGAQNGKAE